jgi:hypothetical protein
VLGFRTWYRKQVGWRLLKISCMFLKEVTISLLSRSMDMFS